jgi:hypothetical protein
MRRSLRTGLVLDPDLRLRSEELLALQERLSALELKIEQSNTQGREAPELVSSDLSID